MQLRIWIFQTGEPIHSDSGSTRPMRAMNLANELTSRGHRVTIWTSSFYHQEKLHRSKEYKNFYINPLLDIHLIRSCGYLKNIGLGRLIDHIILGFNLLKILRKQSIPPDIGFVGYPPIEFAFVAVKWLKAREVPVFVDCKDQWPHIFIRSLPFFIKPLAKFFLAPYFSTGKKTLKYATGITSMSSSFLDWSLSYAGRSVQEFDSVLPLAPTKNTLPVDVVLAARNWWRQKGFLKEDCQKFFFVGTLSHVFDFKPILIAAELAQKKCLDWQFIICGNGEQLSALKAQSKALRNVIFPGWIDRSQYEYLATNSIAGLAPYKNLTDFQMSIPNKILDYLAYGQPVISSLSGEVKRLIRDEGVGLYYDESVGDSCFNCLFRISTQIKLRNLMAAKAKKVFERSFDGDMVYGKFVDKLESLAIINGGSFLNEISNQKR